MALTQPSLIPQPWGSDGQVGNIPQNSSEFGKASWAKGFPTETAQPLIEGGIPPSYLDFQGVLNALSAHAVFMQSGAHYAWSNTLDYPVGCFVLGSDGKLYQALQASGPGYSAGAKNPTTSATYWQIANFAEYLKTSGGTMTGLIAFNGYGVIKNVDTGDYLGLSLYGGQNYTTGASINLRPVESPSQKGWLAFEAFNGQNRTSATLRPDGGLYIGSDKVLTSAGGTLTGRLYADNTAIYGLYNNGRLGIASSEGKAAMLNLFGRHLAGDYAGAVELVAENDDNRTTLALFPGGRCYLNGAEVLTSADSATIAGYAMPSSRYVDLTLGASGSTYTAPADGWFYVKKQANGNNQNLSLQAGRLQVDSYAPTSGSYCGLYIPVRKDTSCVIVYSLGGATVSARFIYAEGAN